MPSSLEDNSPSAPELEPQPTPKAIASRWRRIFTLPSSADVSRIAPDREERLFLLLSIFIGLISGLLVVSFRMAIEWLNVLLLGSAPHGGQLRLVIAPAAAGIVIAILTRWVFPNVRGSGVNQTKAAMYISNGYISFRTVVGKFFLSALAIGSGHSLGPEDPSLQIGAGVASVISRRIGLSRERLRIFAPVGAAAGLAAAFNAPISAILFVIEEVIGTWSSAVLGSIVLSAISSVVIARWFWGAEPMFRIPAISLRDPRELLAYAVLGIVGGVASLIFAKALGYLRPRLRRLGPNAQMFQPAIAGLLVGGIGYFGFAQVMGPGYSAIDQAMHGQFAWKLLLALAVLKIVATTLSFSSGTPGGMFAPTLFVGAMLGAAVGSLEKVFLPHLTGSIGSYALVGMGVLFAAFLRAPLTSVFMVLEVSGNYSIIMPVILANTIAYLLSRSLQPIPIFEIFTHQDGLDLPSMEERREESELHLHLEDALEPYNKPTFLGTQSPAAILKMMQETVAAVALIQCADLRWYAARLEEIQTLAADPEAPQSIEPLLGKERTPSLFPDQPLDTALQPLSRWPLIPITNRSKRGSLEGIITLESVLKRYQQH
ncbi:chloride channel protein [soil metagenome]